MSSTASNYDVPKLGLGLGVAALALLAAGLSAHSTITEAPKAAAPILGFSLLYGIMMFASSYVEEEQHFWYWSTTAWFGILWLKW